MRDKNFDYENSTVDQLKIQATKPDAYAMNKLGWHYGDTDDSLSLYWYQKSAALGNAEGLYNLGVFYISGKLGRKNPEEANRLWHLAAAKQYCSAMCNLGISYYYGNGIKQDYIESKKWIQPAAYNDDPKAMVIMGQFYHLGRGVKINLIEALAWYTLAKERTNEIIQPMANLLRELNTLEIRQAQERASEINKSIKATPYLD